MVSQYISCSSLTCTRGWQEGGCQHLLGPLNRTQSDLALIGEEVQNSGWRARIGLESGKGSLEEAAGRQALEEEVSCSRLVGQRFSRDSAYVLVSNPVPILHPPALLKEEEYLVNAEPSALSRKRTEVCCGGWRTVPFWRWLQEEQPGNSHFLLFPWRGAVLGNWVS